ncbi:hypothetical protein FD754_008629 [Muntiacus muntjak]|uniref:HMG box domain-containing protein n=1 Tax=Muntiacus muntjak TaxID=9888 RepID=A0A5N3WSU1_MUNMU|nr:hypothetical protein FD754_008629 [Muntiacus muntjak]
MAKGDPKKPKGKMSAYVFFVQTCREEHKKKNPEVPTIPGKEKSKFDDMAQADKVHCDWETKHHGPAKGGEKEDPNAPKRPIKSTNPGISTGDVAKKLSKMWNNLSDSEKQQGNSKAKGEFGGTKGPAKVAWKNVDEEDEEEEEKEEEEDE